MTRANEAGTVDRVIALLATIAASEGLTSIQRLSEQLNLPRSTVHRLLEKLSAHDLVVHDRVLHRYQLGPELYRLGSIITRQPMSRIAQPIMRELTEAVDEASLLGILLPAQRKMVFVSKQDSSRPLRYRIEVDVPITLTRGSSGWAILAHMPPDDIDAVIAADLTEGSRAAQQQQGKALKQELANVRAQGYALTRSSRIEGAVGISAPVFKSRHEIYGCVCVTIPEQRFEARMKRDLSTRLMEGAARISSLLGDDAS
jgi:DNA-binding IclR family transcriptional regulator